MRHRGGIWGVLALAALLALPAAAQAEMYVEVYGGGTFAANAADPFSVNPDPNIGILPFQPSWPGRIDPVVQGGLKVGTWFVKEGFLGYNYPDWMKYLGFYTDFSYHRLYFRSQPGVKTLIFSGPTEIFPFVANSTGNAATWAFMFAARCGLLRDSEVPFGRLQPYVAVGPAILFSSQKPSVSFGEGGKSDDGFASESSVDIALAVEAGLRWMALKNVSLDVSFKYRWAQPAYEYTVNDGPFRHNVKFEPTYHLFSFQVGAAYHF